MEAVVSLRMTSQKDEFREIGATRGYSQCILRPQILGYFDLWGENVFHSLFVEDLGKSEKTWVLLSFHNRFFNIAFFISRQTCKHSLLEKRPEVSASKPDPQEVPETNSKSLKTV